MAVRRFDEMTWEEVRDLDRARTLAILPVGATEAHGPHLPLSTDVLISEAMARAGGDRLADAGYEVVLLPALAYSPAAFASGFAGTISLSEATSTALLVEVARGLGEHMTDYLVIADKSTVPVGTAEKVEAEVTQALRSRGAEIPFDVVSNPEFLKEGAAVEDFMRPDRVVVGTDSDRARDVLSELYEPFSRTRDKLMFMGVRDAEMTKYAANAMLATKISFMNEMANLCERLGADVENVRKGIGSDPRIGFSFIFPGCGYGGSCFPKDVKAILGMAKDVGFSPILMQAVEDRNQMQKHRLVERIVESYGNDLSGLVFGMWGLAFKPGTDDVREASSAVMIRELVERGAIVKAYDPVAMETITHEIDASWIGSKLILCDHQYDAIKEANALILATEWNLFRQPDFKAMERVMKNRAIFDGRNQYDPKRLREQGWEYVGIGR